MSALLSWLAGTKVGRAIGAAFVIGLAVLAVVWRSFSAGKAQEKVKQERQALENLRSRSRTDDEIAKTPAAQRRHELGMWVSDGE